MRVPRWGGDAMAERQGDRTLEVLARDRGAALLAYATLITVPVLALFLTFQRAFIGSIASSGVKG